MIDSETQRRYTLIGDVKQDPRGNYCLYDEYHEKIGYYAPVENNTYDAYGRLVGEGDLMEDLPYMQHPLKFPLPELTEVSFTWHKREKAQSIKTKGFSSYREYWDDGKCKICGRPTDKTCHVQGLPGMCKTCYRFFAMYSKGQDSLRLEKASRYNAITARQIKNAIEKTKAPLIAAAKEQERAANRLLFHTAIQALGAFAESLPACQGTEEGTQTPQRQTPRVQDKKPAGTARKKKSRLRWYHWFLIILLIYIMAQYIIPLALFAVWYFFS